MNHYDRPDPGMDPDYCNALDASEPPPLCLWCNEPLTTTDTDYCSAQCSANAGAEEDG